MKNKTLTIVILATVILIAVAGCKKSAEPLKGTWVRLNDFPGGSHTGTASFVIGKYGYMCTGFDKYNWLRDVWQFDSETDSWTEKNQFPGIERSGAVAFTIGNKGYIGLGYNGNNYMNDFWEYDPDTDTWTEKAAFPGSERADAYAFSLNGKGYAGCGFDDNWLNDFYEYDPVNDKWTQISSISGNKRSDGNTFVYGGKGYVFGGQVNGSPSSDFDFYNPSTGLWRPLNETTNKTSMGFDDSYTDLARESGVAFQIGDYAYVSLGQRNATCLQSTWEYDIKNDLWHRVAYFPGEGSIGAAYFSFGTYGVVAGGYSQSGYKKEVWKFVPDEVQD